MITILRNLIERERQRGPLAEPPNDNALGESRAPRCPGISNAKTGLERVASEGKTGSKILCQAKYGLFGAPGVIRIADLGQVGRT